MSSHANSASSDESPGTGPAIIEGLICARSFARDLLFEAGILVEGHRGCCPGMNSNGGRSEYVHSDWSGRTTSRGDRREGQDKNELIVVITSGRTRWGSR